MKVVCLLLAACAAACADWPQFRGEAARGVAEGARLPDSWDVDKRVNVLWKQPIPGLAHASPIVWQDRIFIATAVSSQAGATFKPGLYGDGTASEDTSIHKWQVICLDRKTGKTLWTATAFEGQPKEKRHIKSTYASATPATDGKRVVAFFGSQGLYAFNFDGKLLWKKDLGRIDAGAYDAPDYEWGTASSPIIHDSMVYAQVDQQKGSYLIAVDAATGETRWKTERDELPSWATPAVYTLGARQELITNAPNFIRGYDPKTGKELWRLGGSSKITAPTPVFSKELIYVASGRRPEAPIFAVRPGALGTITLPSGQASNTSVAWSKQQRGSYMPTPLLHGSELYVLGNAGIFDCYDAATGQEIYRERIPHAGSGFSASPVAAGGKIYLSSEDGDIFVLQAGRQFKVLGRHAMGEPLMATPAISGGVMYVRGQKHLFAIGRFSQSADIGAPAKAGAASYGEQGGEIRISASGANIWGAKDSFHFASRTVTGDVEMETAIGWATPGGHEHKKAGLMLRAGLEADAPHASVMVHADGLVSLQFRRVKGGPTEEVRSALKGAERVRLMRDGDVVTMEVAPAGGVFEPSAALTVALGETVEAGLAVCSHDDNDVQTAVFKGFELKEAGTASLKERVVESTLEIVEAATGRRRIVRRAVEHFEAPNWTNDGKTLVYNGGGRIWRIPAAGGEPVHIPTGDVRVNNDHGLSPDGQWMAVSGSVARGQSQIYVMPALGGPMRLVTPKAPSYWHGWSPDGKTLAYCASREGEYDIYTIPVEGGEETRLTTAKGLDDGPEYSPDGRFIYFNSVRSGVMRIWRMKPDGSDQELVSQGPPSADWFAHPSPDGKWLAYISYDASVEGHPANKDVTLRLAPAAGGPPRTLVTRVGGQGTMNVPSWSPDSKHFALVSYRLRKAGR